MWIENNSAIFDFMILGKKPSEGGDGGGLGTGAIIGIVIGALVVVILLIAGGYYLYNNKSRVPKPRPRKPEGDGSCNI